MVDRTGILILSLLITLTRSNPAENSKQQCVNTNAEITEGGCPVASSSLTPSPEQRNELEDYNSQHQQPNQQPQCGLYLAQSTIPNAGLGIFTSVSRVKGEYIGDGDICIPLIDLYWHNDKEGLFNPLYDYFWTGHAMGMSKEVDTDDIEALCPGLDCAINCNIALLNVEKSMPKYDEAGLHRSIDPGVGAFSPYGLEGTEVIRDIPPGGELFKFYGDSWFTVREHIFGLLPLIDDFPLVTDLLTQMTTLNVFKQRETHFNILEEFYEDIIVSSINSGLWESRTLNALPKRLSDAIVAAEAGDIAAAYQPNATRDLNWLQQNGRCIDHIIPGTSTIQQAGKGAFATRNLPSGTIVTTSPLFHFPDFKYMQMYNLTTFNTTGSENGDSDTVTYRLIDDVLQLQLLYNYCFGHSESTMILCPYGAGINYINHNQSLVNVKIQWATGFDIAHAQRLVDNATIEDLRLSPKPQLAFEFVALRDILQGEELFLDYGNDWEEAWQNHMKEYQPYPHPRYDIDPNRYASAQKWNSIFRDHPLRTEAEQVLDPYPINLQMRCSRKLLKINLIPGTEYEWVEHDYGLPCRILDRFIEKELNQREETLYSVQLERSRNDIDMDEEEDEQYIPVYQGRVTWIERTDVPRSAIKFFDMPYSTDIHLQNSFRHEIGIPDEIMPEQWKNNY